MMQQQQHQPSPSPSTYSSPRRVSRIIQFSSADCLPEISPIACVSPRRRVKSWVVKDLSSHSAVPLQADDSVYGYSLYDQDSIRCPPSVTYDCSPSKQSHQQQQAQQRPQHSYFSPPRRKIKDASQQQQQQEEPPQTPTSVRSRFFDVPETPNSVRSTRSKVSVSSICSSARRRVAKLGSNLSIGGSNNNTNNGSNHKNQNNNSNHSGKRNMFAFSSLVAPNLDDGDDDEDTNNGDIPTVLSPIKAIKKKTATKQQPSSSSSLPLSSSHHRTTSTLLSNRKTDEFLTKLRHLIAEQTKCRQEMEKNIAKETELAKARYTNQSAIGALLALRKARSLQDQVRRVTGALQLARDALDSITVKQERAQERAARHARDKYKVNLSEHVNVFDEIEQLLSGDTEETADIADNNKNNDKVLLEQLRQLTLTASCVTKR